MTILRGRDGRQHVVHRAGPGSTIGEVPLLLAELRREGRLESDGRGRYRLLEPPRARNNEPTTP